MSKTFDNFLLQYSAVGSAANDGYDRKTHFDGMSDSERDTARQLLKKKLSSDDANAVRGLALLDGVGAVPTLEAAWSRLSQDKEFRATRETYKLALLGELARITMSDRYIDALAAEADPSDANQRNNIYALFSRLGLTTEVFNHLKKWLIAEANRENVIYLASVVFASAEIKLAGTSAPALPTTESALASRDLAARSAALEKLQSVLAL